MDTTTHTIIKTEVIDLTFTRDHVSKDKKTYIDRCCLDLSDSTYPFYLSIIQESHYKPNIFELAVQNPLTGNLMYNHPLAVHLQDITKSDDYETVFRMNLTTLNNVLKLVQIDANQLYIYHVKEPLYETIKKNLLTKAEVKTVKKVKDLDGPRLTTNKHYDVFED